MTLVVRDAKEADVDVLADLVFASFRQTADEHRAYTFTASSREVSRSIVAEAVAADHVVALVAESQGGSSVEGFAAVLALSGSVFMLDTVAVAVGRQGRGGGRVLVEAALARAATETAANGQGTEICEVRLLVDTYNMRALALYSRCGFVVTGTVTVLDLPASRDGSRQEEDSAYCVRAMTAADVSECTALARRLASLDSAGELAGHLSEAVVVLGSSGLVGYCSRVTMTGHLVCEDGPAARALLGWVGQQASGEVRQLCVPLQQQPELARWMLDGGWRAVKTLLQMSHGPQGQSAPGAVYFPMC